MDQTYTTFLDAKKVKFLDILSPSDFSVDFEAIKDSKLVQNLDQGEEDEK